MKTKENLLKDAVGIKEKIAQWREDAEYCKGADLIAEAVQNNDQNAEVYQSPHYPEFALLAYLDDKISLAQFTTLTFRWSAFQDNGEDIDSVQHHSLNSSNSIAAEAMRPFLRLLISAGFGDRGYINIELPQNEFENFVKGLQAESIPESERCFTLLRLKNNTELPALYHVFQQLGFSLFMPMYEDGQYTVLVPSFSMLENFLRVLSPKPIELCPVIGDTSGQGVLEFHQTNAHPLGISFPGYEHTEADGHQSKRLMFVFHDLYHIVLLIFVKMLMLINKSADIGQRYLREHQIAEDSLLHERVGFLVDAELGEYYRLAVLEKLGLTRHTEQYSQLKSGELNFAHLLSRFLLEKIPGLDENKQEAVQHQSEIAALIVADLINHREDWRNCGIDVAKCLDKLCHNEELVELMKKSGAQAGEDGEVFLALSVNSLQALKKIVVDILEGKKYQHLLDAGSQEWLKQIRECQNRLFSVVNQGDLDQLQDCLRQIKERQLPISMNTVDASGRTILAVAVMKQRDLIVKCLLAEGADVNAVVSKAESKVLEKNRSIVCGTRVLHLAAQKDNPRLLDLLISSGANLEVYDARLRSPIDIAIECGHVGAFNCLIQYCEMSDAHIKYLQENNSLEDEMQQCLDDYKNQRTEFIRLLKGGEIEPIKAFLVQYPHFRVYKTLFNDTYSSVKNAFLLVTEDSEATSAFDIALKTNNLLLLALLFERSPVDQQRNQALIQSIQAEVIRDRGWTPLVTKKLDLILANNANLNAFLAVREGLLSGAKTLTFWSILRDIGYSKGFIAIINTGSITMPISVRKMCIIHGADVNHPNKNGLSELMTATIAEDSDYAHFLLEHGASVNSFDQSSSRFGTVLHVACASGTKPLVELFIARGADLAALNSNGFTPWQVAIANGHEKLLEDCFPDSARVSSHGSTSECSLDRLPRQTLARVPLKKINVGRPELFSAHPELRDRIRQLRSNLAVEVGSVKLSEHCHHSSIDYDLPIFKSPLLWEYALCAVHKNTISVSHFATLMIRMAYFQKFSEGIQSVQHFCLSGNNQFAKATLGRFIGLSGKRTENILRRISQDSSTAVDTTFSVITLREHVFVGSFMIELSAYSPIPFLPIQEGGQISVLIPTFTLLASTVEALFPERLKLVPVFGRFNIDEQLSFMQKGVMPLELSASENQSADAIFGCYVKALVLSANPNQQFLHKIFEIYRSVQMLHPSVEKLPFIELLTHEKGQPLLHYSQAIRCDEDQKIDTAYPEILFQCLVACFGEEEKFDIEVLKNEIKEELLKEQNQGGDPSEVDSKKLEEAMIRAEEFVADEEKSRAEKHLALTALLKALMEFIILQREECWEKYRFPVGTFLDLFSATSLSQLKRTILKSFAADKVRMTPLGYDVSAAVRSIFQPNREEFVDLFILMAEKVKVMIKEALDSSNFSEVDRAWFEEAFSQRKRLSDAASHNAPVLIELIQKLHDQWQFDFTLPLEDGSSILSVVCKNNNAEALKLLLSFGLGVNLPNSTQGFLTRLVHIAAENNAVEVLKALLEAGFELDVYNETKLSPLGIALIAGHTGIIEVCLSQLDVSGAHIEWLKAHFSIHPSAMPLLERYCSFRRELSEFLRLAKADAEKLSLLKEKYTGLSLNAKLPSENDSVPEVIRDYDFALCAAEHKYCPVMHFATKADMVRLLFQHGVDINAVDCYGDTSLLHNLERLPLKRKIAASGVFWAQADSVKEHLELIDALIELGASVVKANKSKKAALDVAIVNEEKEIVSKLLVAIKKESPDKACEFFTAGLSQVITLVMRKRQWTENAIIFCQSLLKSGVELQRRFTLKTKLFDTDSLFGTPRTQSLWQMLRRISLGHNDILEWIEEGTIELPLVLRELCVRSGADVNEPMQNGQTELFYAIENGQADYLRLLIQKGADLNARGSSDQLTPREFALKLGKTRCVEIIDERSNHIPTFGFLTPVKPKNSEKEELLTAENVNLANKEKVGLVIESHN